MRSSPRIISCNFPCQAKFQGSPAATEKETRLDVKCKKAGRNEQTCLRETQNPSEITHPNTHFLDVDNDLLLHDDHNFYKFHP